MPTPISDRIAEIDVATVSDLALGASFLGTGGGGDPLIGELMARAAIAEHGPVQLVTPEHLSPDATVVPFAMIGAPTVILERIPGGHELGLAMDEMTRLLGRPVDATMPIEAGGINSTIPLVLAARRGLPVVDADGMGRAFPEVQMVTLGAGGATAWPLTLVDETGTTVSVTRSIDNASAERAARAVVVSMGGSAIIGHYAVSGSHVRDWAVPNTVTLAVNIGRALRHVADHGGEAVDALAHVCGAQRLFSGKIVDVDRRTTAGFARGTLTVEGLEGDAGSVATIDFQNENLLARREGEVLATVPELITLIDADTGRPLTTEGTRYGIRVHVVGTPASDIWWRPEALRLVDPAAFGYDLPPQRMEAAR